MFFDPHFQQVRLLQAALLTSRQQFQQATNIPIQIASKHGALDCVKSILSFIAKHYPEQLRAAADGKELGSPRRSPRNLRSPGAYLHPSDSSAISSPKVANSKSTAGGSKPVDAGFSAEKTASKTPRAAAAKDNSSFASIAKKPKVDSDSDFEQ